MRSLATWKTCTASPSPTPSRLQGSKGGAFGTTIQIQAAGALRFQGPGTSKAIAENSRSRPSPSQRGNLNSFPVLSPTQAPTVPRVPPSSASHSRPELLPPGLNISITWDT